MELVWNWKASACARSLQARDDRERFVAVPTPISTYLCVLHTSCLVHLTPSLLVSDYAHRNVLEFTSNIPFPFNRFASRRESLAIFSFPSIPSRRWLVACAVLFCLAHSTRRNANNTAARPTLFCKRHLPWLPR